MIRNPVGSPLAMPGGYGNPADGCTLDWAPVERRLVAASNYWLATTRPDGAPHVTPVWGVWVADALYFDGIPTALWARNTARNPAACVHLESGDEVVILDGVVEDVSAIEDAVLARAIVAQWSEKYGRLVPDPVNDGMFCLRVSRARAWTEFPADATAWTFEQPDRDGVRASTTVSSAKGNPADGHDDTAP
jgi:hypothetical protein